LYVAVAALPEASLALTVVADAPAGGVPAVVANVPGVGVPAPPPISLSVDSACQPYCTLVREPA
jgi:hypothetical protein